MNLNSLLLTADKLKKYTDIPDNVDDKLLTTAIYDAQQIELQEILGTKLLRELIDAVSTTGGTTELQATLLNDYIFDVMVKYSYVRALPSIYVQTTNSGLIKKQNETSIPVENSEFYIKYNNAKNDAEFYSERLIDFLCDKSTDYPSYINTTKSSDMIPVTSKYNSGIYVDKKVGNYDKLTRRWY